MGHLLAVCHQHVEEVSSGTSHFARFQDSAQWSHVGLAVADLCNRTRAKAATLARTTDGWHGLNEMDSLESKSKGGGPPVI